MALEPKNRWIGMVSMSMIRWNMQPVAGRVEQQDGLAWGTRNEFRKNGNELSSY